MYFLEHTIHSTILGISAISHFIEFWAKHIIWYTERQNGHLERSTIESSSLMILLFSNLLSFLLISLPQITHLSNISLLSSFNVKSIKWYGFFIIVSLKVFSLTYSMAMLEFILKLFEREYFYIIKLYFKNMNIKRHLFKYFRTY